jgi:16S rRNA (uracil1498-N3)-methyltransferase
VQYLYHPEAGAAMLFLEGEDHHYLFRVRRVRQGERVALRSLTDSWLHHYTVAHIDRKRAQLVHSASEDRAVIPVRSLHIGWCLIDPKRIEKVLPMLNETGVERITFFPCARSQKNFRLDLERMKKILLVSMQQCGRTAWMQLDEMPTLSAFVSNHPEAYLLHFSDRLLPNDAADAMTVIIGCEGGFTDEEIALAAPNRIVGLNTSLILRSESAAVAVANKMLI